MNQIVRWPPTLGHTVLLDGALLTARWSGRAVWGNILGRDVTSYPRLWAAEGLETCYRPLGILLDIRDELGDIPPDTNLLVFGNHPSSMALFGFVHAVTTRSNLPVVPVGKVGHRWNPFFGWGAEAVGTVMLSRTNTERDIRTLQRAVTRRQGRPAQYIIFCDGHRAFPERIAKAKAEAIRRGRPDVADWLQHTCAPKAGGLHTLLTNLPTKTIVVEVTTTLSVLAHKVFEVDRLQGARCVVRLRRADGLPREKKALQEELFRRWAQMNHFIDVQITW